MYRGRNTRNVYSGKTLYQYSSQMEQTIGIWFFQDLHSTFNFVCSDFGKRKTEEQNNKKITLPQFRKNIYTKEIIEFILGKIESGEMTKNQVMERYSIPKTTLYKWISKYGNSKTIWKNISAAAKARFLLNGEIHKLFQTKIYGFIARGDS